MRKEPVWYRYSHCQFYIDAITNVTAKLVLSPCFLWRQWLPRPCPYLRRFKIIICTLCNLLLCSKIALTVQYRTFCIVHFFFNFPNVIVAGPFGPFTEPDYQNLPKNSLPFQVNWGVWVRGRTSTPRAQGSSVGDLAHLDHHRRPGESQLPKFMGVVAKITIECSASSSISQQFRKYFATMPKYFVTISKYYKLIETETFLLCRCDICKTLINN